jgi:hypothetical protein
MMVKWTGETDGSNRASSSGESRTNLRFVHQATRVGSCPGLADVIDTTGASGSATGAVLDL